VRFRRIDAEWPLKILAEHFACGAGRFLGRVEIMLHGETTSHKEHEVHNGNQIAILFARVASRRARRYKRKPGGKLNSPPGLKLGVVTPKAFGVVMKRGALMPLSLCFFLGRLFAFFCHRLFPPFNPQMRRVVKSSR